MAEPHFAMLWAENIPMYTQKDKNGKSTQITIIAGKLGDITAPEPAPDSWAVNPENEVAIWLIKMEANAQWTIPPALHKINRAIYFYKGSDINMEDTKILPYHSVDFEANQAANIENGDEEALILLLQGKPIHEPIVQYGPFVMNSKAEIQQAFSDYQQNQFGGWPWPRNDYVHERNKGRFAKYADGKEEIK